MSTVDVTLDGEEMLDFESLYRRLCRMTSDATFLLSTNGRWIDFNDAAIELLGYDSAAQLETVALRDLCVDPAERKAYLRELRKRGIVVEYPLELRRGDGGVLAALVTCVALRDEAGTLVGYQGVIRRATAAERMDRALEASHQRLTNILDSIDAHIYAADMESHEILFMNQKMRDDFGGDLVGEICWDVFRGESGPCAHCTNDRLIDGDGVPTGVYVWEGQNPITERWYINYDRAVEWPERGLARLQIATDITERKRAEQALRRRDAILEAVSFASEEFLTATSWEESIEGVLERLGEAAGVSRVYVFENRVRADGTLVTTYRCEWAAPGVPSQIGDPDLRDSPFQADGFGRWEEMLGRGQPIYGPVNGFPEREARTLSAQGIESVVAVPVFVGPEWWGFVGFDDCLHEREWSAAEIDALKAAAGTLGAAIQRERIGEQLRQQERLAAVGQLAAGVAHDFRNLLTTILLFAERDLNRPDLPQGVVDDLQVIIDESNRASDLVQQMLDFSSRAMIERRPLNLHSFVADVVTQVLRPGIPEHIEIELAAESEEPDSRLTVEADPGRIQQVLTNLTLNARDAMPEGGELCFTVSRVEVLPGDTPPVTDMSPGEFVCLTVADTGTGMTDEVEAHLFEPFFTTKDVDEGTGLGLAQVYGIVRQHGGAIDVETELGRGSVFRIYFPALEEGVEESEGEEDGVLPGGGGETILFVEDHEALRQAGESILTSLGYRVLTAATGLEALERIESAESSGVPTKIDLLITDLVMPEMGGRELVRKLRALCPQLRALAVTGHALQQEDREDLKKDGFAEVVRKPFDANELATAARRALDEHAGRREA